MSQRWVFDMSHAMRFVEARRVLMRSFLPDLQRQIKLQTALDVGCGVGYFSELLRDTGFSVVAFDGRRENVEEARSRFPEISFLQADAEDVATQNLGSFDLVLCFGFLYHLENPFRAIRNLHALTAKILLIESMCVPQQQPVLCLLDESHDKDQGLHYVAFYPSEACLVKMLYRSGFSFVYRLGNLPVHEDFHSTLFRKKMRTMLAASKVPLNHSSLTLVSEPQTGLDGWATVWGKLRRLVEQPYTSIWRPVKRLMVRVNRFNQKTWADKWATLSRHLRLS